VLSPRHARAAWKRWPFPPVELFTGPVDVVHSPNYVVPPTRRAAAVVTVHDLTFVNHPELCTADTRSFPPLIAAAVARGAWVHAVSRFVADEVVAAFDVPAERVVVVPNATEPLVAGTAAEGRGLAGGERYVLAIGTIEPRKNLPRLVAAWQQVADTDPELRLVVAGGEGWGAAELAGALVTARHTDRIVRLGRVDDHQRAALLRGATVLAYPSLYEGFGIPPLEAMAAGTPVVAARAGALPETCGDAALLVDPHDVDDIAAAIAAVTTDESLAADLVRRGERRVAGYSWDRSARELVDLYHRAAGR
jgi:glycosyltransferase involved in cell wall biosynthesis